MTGAGGLIAPAWSGWGFTMLCGAVVAVAGGARAGCNQDASPVVRNRVMLKAFTMTDVTYSVLQTYPARAPTDGEREILRGWIATADRFFAFVSERRGDDPSIYRRIVIAHRRTKQHAYLVHAPQGLDVWVVASVKEREDIGRFTTLRAALEFVQAVPSVGEPMPA
jgi:hypothetical protein